MSGAGERSGLLNSDEEMSGSSDGPLSDEDQLLQRGELDLQRRRVSLRIFTSAAVALVLVVGAWVAVLPKVHTVLDSRSSGSRWASPDSITAGQLIGASADGKASDPGKSSGSRLFPAGIFNLKKGGASSPEQLQGGISNVTEASPEGDARVPDKLVAAISNVTTKASTVSIPNVAMVSVAGLSNLAQVGAPETGAPTSLPWNYDGFRLGDWPAKGFPLCAGLPNPPFLNNEWQSPIDIDSVDEADTIYAVAEGKLDFIAVDHGCSKVSFSSMMHTFTTSYGECANLTARWKGRDYRLKTIHFHAESETQIDGSSFPGEMQLFHQADDGAKLIISVLLKTTKAKSMSSHHPPNPFVSRVLNERFDEENSRTFDGKSKRLMNPYRQLFNSGSSFYSYLGSMTTPPCEPDVEWITMAAPVLIRKDHLRNLRRFLAKTFGGGNKDNYGQNVRPVQPLNGRSIVMGSVGSGAGQSDTDS
eukprot:TRINITY_DN5028_c0_g1_i2.p1 TRINITY_DN5028_c0_g1~~TRINITY_DN5028_c0_g1_i2.p1  ORF type:complete len:475 (+),score=88.97 TRINITY_DN5028_c0_g1_i2:104-1528(+)